MALAAAALENLAQEVRSYPRMIQYRNVLLNVSPAPVVPLCGSLIKIRYHNGPVDKIKNSAGNPQCFQQNSKFGDMLAELDTEEDDLQFAMTAYGLCVLLETHGETEKVDALREKLLARDGFWFCFSYLAAYSDHKYTVKPAAVK